MSPKMKLLSYWSLNQGWSNDDRLRARLDSEMEPDTHLELSDCKVDFLQADEEAERGHMGWECTEAGHVDKTTRSCQRIPDPSP